MEIGQIIKERYEIIQLLGEGGMSYVYKANDKQLKRTVAIKTLKPNYVQQEKFVERFKREAQTAANLNHPNIVQIFDWGIGDEPFFVMEYIEGTVIWESHIPHGSETDRFEIYASMNETIANLHSVDPYKIGLENFGKPGNYVARQVSRWTKQYRNSETEEISLNSLSTACAVLSKTPGGFLLRTYDEFSVFKR